MITPASGATRRESNIPTRNRLRSDILLAPHRLRHLFPYGPDQPISLLTGHATQVSRHLMVAIALFAGQLNQSATAQTLPPASQCFGHVDSTTRLGSLKVASSTRWVPVGGQILFTLREIPAEPGNLSVWFNWQDGNTSTCRQSPRVLFVGKSTVLGDATKIEYTYSVQLPSLDTDSQSFPWIEGRTHWNFKDIAPLADVFVHADLGSDHGEARQILMMGSVGVSTPWLAFVAAVGLVGVAWSFLLSWATARGVRGGRLLRVISTPHGVASLSQFQIVIWSTVIGAGIIYVMLISGNLIDIPATTLGLLGVTGITLVGSKIQANADGTPKRLSPPGVVTNLAVTGTPTSNTAVLSWVPPAGAEQPLSYTVQMRQSGAGGWHTGATDIGAPPFAVTGLLASTQYDFQVFAVSAAGSSLPSPLVSAVTAAPSAAATVGPDQITGLTANATPDGSVLLQWTLLNPAPSAYVIQYRAAGNLAWATYSNTANSPQQLVGLDAGTTFEFQVFAIAGGATGTPSSVVLATTALRTPQWSDLVMSGEQNVEIDLSRVQMLLFTSIAAAFTGMTLIGTGVIPDIPLGILALVGLSNGVYLASKTVGSSR